MAVASFGSVTAPSAISAVFTAFAASSLLPTASAPMWLVVIVLPGIFGPVTASSAMCPVATESAFSSLPPTESSASLSCVTASSASFGVVTLPSARSSSVHASVSPENFAIFPVREPAAGKAGIPPSLVFSSSVYLTAAPRVNLRLVEKAVEASF